MIQPRNFQSFNSPNRSRTSSLHHASPIQGRFNITADSFKKHLDMSFISEQISPDDGQETLSLGGTALAFISTIIGGGIVSLPYAFVTAGITTGLICHFLAMTLMLASVWFLLKSKDHLGYESFSEIAYICFGRFSVFFINLLITFCISGIITLYMILFSRICLSLFSNFDLDSMPLLQNLLNEKAFYIIVLYILLLPNIIKKKIHELRFASYLLIIGVVLLTATFTYKVISGDTQVKASQSTFISDQPQFKLDKAMDSMNIVLAAYGFVINFFPIYSSMRNRTNAKGLIACMLALLFCFTAYTFFSIMAMISYGTNLNPNIFEHIQKDEGVLSITIRAFFLLIFFCNISFVFYPGKESFLMFLLELRERKISRRLDQQLEFEIKQRLIEEQEASEHPSEALSEVDFQFSNTIYYTVVFGLFTTQALLAMAIDDLTLIFGIISAFAEASIAFTFPGLFFYISSKKAQQKVPLYQKVAALAFSSFGILYFLVSNYFNLKKVI